MFFVVKCMIRLDKELLYDMQNIPSTLFWFLCISQMNDYKFKNEFEPKTPGTTLRKGPVSKLAQGSRVRSPAGAKSTKVVESTQTWFP